MSPKVTNEVVRDGNKLTCGSYSLLWDSDSHRGDLYRQYDEGRQVWVASIGVDFARTLQHWLKVACPDDDQAEADLVTLLRTIGLGDTDAEES